MAAALTRSTIIDRMEYQPISPNPPREGRHYAFGLLLAFFAALNLTAFAVSDQVLEEGNFLSSFKVLSGGTAIGSVLLLFREMS